MKHLSLYLGNDLAGVPLVPVPVQELGHAAKLDQEVAGQVLRLGLAALLPPQPQQRRLVVAHDDPGIGATDEAAAIAKCVGNVAVHCDPTSLRFGRYSILKVSISMNEKSILKVSIRQVKAARA